MNHTKNILRYFNSFSRKDLNALSDLFSDSITLKDWNVSVAGKKSVLDVNRNIFKNSQVINVKPLALYSNNSSTYVAQIKIQFDSEKAISVVDLIEFDSDEKICKITAYLRQ